MVVISTIQEFLSNPGLSFVIYLGWGYRNYLSVFFRKIAILSRINEKLHNKTIPSCTQPMVSNCTATIIIKILNNFINSRMA